MEKIVNYCKSSRRVGVNFHVKNIYFLSPQHVLLKLFLEKNHMILQLTIIFGHLCNEFVIL
jgi:hypothetical protein